jgi:hypothetical protein
MWLKAIASPHRRVRELAVALSKSRETAQPNASALRFRPRRG